MGVRFDKSPDMTPAVMFPATMPGKDRKRRFRIVAGGLFIFCAAVVKLNRGVTNTPDLDLRS
jgi:hypothetical protein